MRVLLITHNPISTCHNMGKTFLSLFVGFSNEELCQFFIYPSVPDVKKCRSYFRMTDKSILKSVCLFSARGTVIQPDETCHSLYEKDSDALLYGAPKNKRPSRVLARDLMWKLSRWDTRALNEWIREQNPTHIFVAPGTAKFIYDIALKISKRYSLPIVTYICDDYYFVKPHATALGRFQQKLLREKIRELLSRTSHIVTICPELEAAYRSEFGVPSTTIMTGTNYSVADSVSAKEHPSVLTYMGNIRCGRFHSLAEIGKALDELNSANGTDYQLDIYSGEKEDSILDSFAGIRSIHFKGFVGGQEFERIFHSSELLLHTEAFDEDSIDLVKHSVSTKIADSLASGIPLFAYGPESVSSMKHLIRNNCAIVSTSRERLKQDLLRCFQDYEQRKDVAQNGLKCAHKYHDSDVNSKLLREIIFGEVQ